MSPGLAPELVWYKTDASPMGLEEQDTVSFFTGEPQPGHQKQSHKCWMEGFSHFPWPFGYAHASVAQYVVSLHCHKGTLLNHVQPVVLQHPWIFCKVAFSPVSAHPVLLYRVITHQVQGSCQPIHWPANVLDTQVGWWIKGPIEMKQFTYTGKQKCRSVVDLGRPSLYGIGEVI